MAQKLKDGSVCYSESDEMKVYQCSNIGMATTKVVAQNIALGCKEESVSKQFQMITGLA